MRWIKLTDKEAFLIAQEYKDKYEFYGQLTGEVRFYEKFSKNVKGFTAWLVIGKIETLSPEDDNEYEIVVSDETALVEYIIDINGFEQYLHIEDGSLTEEELKEFFEDDKGGAYEGGSTISRDLPLVQPKES